MADIRSTMCSVSFIPRDDGFILAMNRDELRSRPPALAPEVHLRGELAVLCPRERSGGTWIGINSAGMTFSLINWHAQPDRASEDLVSRGEVVRVLLSARSLQTAAQLIRQLSHERMNPFRLIALSLSEQSLVEWRSGVDRLERVALPWTRQHWFSSGFDEARTNDVRRQVCARASDDALDSPRLRELHGSHLPQAGPFSICMHRPEAGTVSYTEIKVRGSRATVYYISGPPCSSSERFKTSLDLVMSHALPEVA